MNSLEDAVIHAALVRYLAEKAEYPDGVHPSVSRFSFAEELKKETEACKALLDADPHYLEK